MPYTPYHADWKDADSATGGGDTTTPITSAALEHIETGIDDAHVLIDDHIADTADAHDATAISIVDTGGYFTGTDVETALQESAADIAAMGTPASLALIIALG